MSSYHPCPDAPALSRRLIQLATLLREGAAPVHEVAIELDSLAARASWASVLVTNHRELTRRLRLAVEEADQLVRTSQLQVHRTLELLEGGELQENEDLSPLRPDAEGHYAWDRWQAQALAAGLNWELAALGRAVMREAAQHAWDPDLKAECGWDDAGQAMLEQALHDGPAADSRWTYLLNTDGLRGRWTEEGGWQPFDQEPGL